MMKDQLEYILRLTIMINTGYVKHIQTVNKKQYLKRNQQKLEKNIKKY